MLSLYCRLSSSAPPNLHIINMNKRHADYKRGDVARLSQSHVNEAATRSTQNLHRPNVFQSNAPILDLPLSTPPRMLLSVSLSTTKSSHSGWAPQPHKLGSGIVDFAKFTVKSTSSDWIWCQRTLTDEALGLYHQCIYTRPNYTPIQNPTIPAIPN